MHNYLAIPTVIARSRSCEPKAWQEAKQSHLPTTEIATALPLLAMTVWETEIATALRASQ